MPLVVPEEFQRGHHRKDDFATRSAHALLEYVARHFGLDSLAQVEMLDVGCGTKFTQAFVDGGALVARYVGIDVYREMIEFLQASVDDPRCSYYHFDAYNERYNPKGRRLDETSALPIASSERFDLITLFSVFTHLDPNDYVEMLRLLRPHAKPDGRLFFSLYLDERSDGGHGLMDGIARTLGDAAVGVTGGYRDLKPESPLEWAVYSRDRAVELVGGSGWAVERIDPPTEFVQHHMTCRPI
jgi:SAM-dependent methyltransferase